LELPNLPPKGDVSDWLAAGGDKSKLLELATKARPVTRHVETATPEAGHSASDKPEFPAPVALSKLAAEDVGDLWDWQGLLAFGGLTLFHSLWKCGKTTALAHFIKAKERGGILFGQAVRAGGVLLISEEPAHLWISRRDEMQLGDHVLTLLRPFKSKPKIGMWERFIEYAAKICNDEGLKTVLIDTLSATWPVVDENDAGLVTEAMFPLRALADKGIAVMGVHHPRKSDGDQATASRGSGALPAAVDIIIEFRRFNPADRRDRRRVLTCYSRYAKTPDEVVVELKPDGMIYHVLGDRQEANEKQRVTTMLQILPDTPPGLTPDEIETKWPEPKPSKRSIQAWLSNGVGRTWDTTGEGKKNDPLRYFRRRA
jgi:hypothetical protein